MSKSAIEDLSNFTFSQTDNSPLDLCGNSHLLSKTSNLGHDFNIDLNKTVDLNKCDEHVKASGGIKTVLEPFNEYTFDCTNQKKNTIESLESDESLGILPEEILNDELTFDPFKTQLCFSDDEIHDVFNPEINENPPSFVFSPPSDNQFNRISLFLKNISTPLPNFGNERRYSSTPKILAAGQPIANTAEYYSSPQFLPDEAEEPIAGSCHIKFETDFNLDDLKNVKPLTSTYKTFSPPQLPFILNESIEETDLKSENNFKKNPKTIGNLNITQTFCHNVADLNSCEHEDNMQNVNILNNTFQIKQSVFVESADSVESLKCSIPSSMKISQARSCSEIKKVKMLDSTFAIPIDEISCNMDCEKTVIIDFNSTIGTEASSKSFYKERMFNETYVLEMGSTEFSKQQEQIANATFTKDLENDIQTSFEHHCYSSQGTAFKPMTQILEETFCSSDFQAVKPILEKTFSGNGFKAMTPILEETSENDLNEIKVHSKNDLECFNNKSQSFPETFNIKANDTFSENVEVFPGAKAIQNDKYLLQFASSNSEKALTSNIFHEQPGEKNCFHDQISLTENENAPSNKMSPSVALQSITDATLSEEIDERTDREIEKFHKIESTENVNSIIELASPKALASTTFNEEVGGNIYFHNEINCSENENDLSNKMSFSIVLQSTRGATFSEEINKIADQEIDKFHKRDSTENVNIIAELASPKVLVSPTFNEEVGKISLHNYIDDSEYDPEIKMSRSDPLQSITDTDSSEKLNEKSDVEIGKFYERDSIINESSGKLTSKISQSLTFSDRSEVANLFESSVFQDSSDIEQGAPNPETIFSGKTTYSFNLNQSNNCHGETNFPKAIEGSMFTRNTSEETEFFTHSISEEDCFEVLPTSSNIYASATFSEKVDPFQSDMDLISNENDQVKISKNLLKEMTNAPILEKTVELISIATENDKFQTSHNSLKEINAPFSSLADKDTKIQPEMQVIQCDQDSLGKTASSSLRKLCLKGTPSRKATDKLNSSLKSCSLESKTVLKSGLIKPTKIVYPKKVSEHRNGQLPIAKPLPKPILDKRSIISDSNRTLNLSDNSTGKSFSKNFNRRLTVSCSSESDVNKYKNDFKKPVGIPAKLGIKRLETNFQKSRLDKKYSNGPLKDINTPNNNQNMLTQPDLISGKDPKIVKSGAVASVNTKGPISSRLCLPEKLSLGSFKMKKCGLKSNTALAYTAEKSSDKVISCPKVVDLPKKDKVSKIVTNNGNPGKNHSKHSIATNLPKKFLSFSNVSSKTFNSKPTEIKQKSAPASNSCKPDVLKPPGNTKLPNSIAKLKLFSSPKVSSFIENSSDESESKSVANKRPAFGNKKANGFLMKPCIPEGEAVHFAETHSTGHIKQKDNKREITQPTSIKFPSRERNEQPLNPSSVKKSNGQCNFLPMPKIIKSNIGSVNSSNGRVAQESQLQNQVCQKTSGKLPQLRRIPAPR